MNEVLTKILRDKGKAYGIAIADLMENPKLLARFKQNVKLCEDYDVPLVLASFASKPSQLRSADDYAAVAILLGVQKPVVALRNLHDHLEKPLTE
jgi:RNase P/RNase MRP subunit p30